MSLPATIRHIRKELTAGDHLHRCMADAALRSEGWRRMQAAKRLARRLNLNHIASV